MRYKAVLITEEKLERVIQTFSEDLGKIRDWSKAILKAHPNGLVKVYEIKAAMLLYYRAVDFEDELT